MNRISSLFRLKHLVWCGAVAITLTGCGGGGDTAGTAAQPAAIISTAPTPPGPVVNGVPPMSVVVGAKYQYVPSVTDGDTHPLAFDIANKPDWATFVEATGELSGSPQANAVGMTGEIEIGVSDGTRRASVGPFRVRIVAAPTGPAPPPATAPQITGTPATSATVGHAYSFTPTVGDSSGAVLIFSVVNRPAWATFSSMTGELSGTPKSANEGSFANILISVSSPSASVSLAAFSITVNPAGSTPSALESIAITPTIIQLAPGGTRQLIVTGTYADNTTEVLPAAGESFHSSDTTVATVGATALVTLAADAAIGATATISATDTVSGKTTVAKGTAQVTVTAPSVGPTVNSRAAATATAQNNALCGAAITPFYWEVGDESGALVSGSQGTAANGPVVATTKFSIASASKWIYATYVTQVRGSAARLTAQDVNFLHFTSGYTNIGNLGANQCPNAEAPDSANLCLTQSNPLGVSFAAQDPNTVGKFDYDGGHMENHASQLTSLGNVDVRSLGKTVQAFLGTGVSIDYSEPLMAGGIYTTGETYALILRHVLDGTLAMHDALGTNAVCTRPSGSCNAVFSPIREDWHYSIGHWVENDPKTNGDGAFSSPGAFGFYPWIDASKKYYGVISRQQSAVSGEQQGYASVQCGRLIRHAWMTGKEQTQPLPTN